jgi:hypothetical protein
VKRDNEGNGMVWVMQSDMATALTHDDQASLPRADTRSVPENDREPAAQAGSGSLRRTTPISSDRPSSRIPST